MTSVDFFYPLSYSVTMNPTFNYILNILTIVIAIAFDIGAAYSVYRIIKLNKHLKEAIVLVPLYRKRWVLFSFCVLITLIFAFCSVMLFIFNYYFVATSLILIIFGVIALFTSMLNFRSAVLDNGILVPYRFIDWLHFYEFEFKGGNELFISGDKQGYSTFTSATGTLKFNKGDFDKLNYILNENKVKNTL